MTLDLTKPVQLIDGRPVRILCSDAEGEWPIVGLVTTGHSPPKSVEAWRFNNLGQSRYGAMPLQNIPLPARFVWINVYATGEARGHESRAVANKASMPDRKHLLQVNIDTGETKVNAPQEGERG